MEVLPALEKRLLQYRCLCVVFASTKTTRGRKYNECEFKLMPYEHEHKHA